VKKEFVIGKTMLPKYCKDLNIRTFNDLLGIFICDDYTGFQKGIYINLSSIGFAYISDELKLIKRIIQTDNHETFHSIINEFIGFERNRLPMEEKLVKLMTGESRWKPKPIGTTERFK